MGEIQISLDPSAILTQVESEQIQGPALHATSLSGKQDLVPHVTLTDISGSSVVGRATDVSLYLCSFHHEICRNQNTDAPV